MMIRKAGNYFMSCIGEAYQDQSLQKSWAEETIYLKVPKAVKGEIANPVTLITEFRAAGRDLFRASPTSLSAIVPGTFMFSLRGLV